MITFRSREVSRLNQNFDDDKLHDEVRTNVLAKADEFISCLRRSSDPEIPESLIPA